MAITWYWIAIIVLLCANITMIVILKTMKRERHLDALTTLNESEVKDLYEEVKKICNSNAGTAFRAMLNQLHDDAKADGD